MTTPTARFLGWQEDSDGGEFPLFNLLQPVGIYPTGTTLGLETLLELGVPVPEGWQDGGGGAQKAVESKETAPVGILT